MSTAVGPANLPVQIDLDAYHGDSWSQPFRLKNDATPYDLTTATVKSTARAPNGFPYAMTVVKTNAVGGEFALYQPLGGLPPERYDYDVQIEAPAGVFVTWIRGYLTVDRDVTT